MRDIAERIPNAARSSLYIPVRGHVTNYMFPFTQLCHITHNAFEHIRKLTSLG